MFPRARPASALLVAMIAMGCAAPTPVIFGGVGPGPTAIFRVAGGWYHFHWTAHDSEATDHGCLLGLAIEETDVAEPRAVDPIGHRQPPKLAYQTVGVGDLIAGDAPAVLLRAGAYRLRAEGGCRWEAQMLPSDPGAVPSPTLPGLEQKEAVSAR